MREREGERERERDFVVAGLIRKKVRGEIKARAIVGTPNNQRKSELEWIVLVLLEGFFWHLALFMEHFN